MHLPVSPHNNIYAMLIGYNYSSTDTTGYDSSAQRKEQSVQNGIFRNRGVP